MSNVRACGKCDESHEISIVKEILKWQLLTAAESASELCSWFTLKLSLRGDGAVPVLLLTLPLRSTAEFSWLLALAP